MGGVLVFDEVQTLPLGLAIPTLAALAHLSKRYRTSVVFATATQPAFGHLDDPVRRWAGAGWTAREMAPPNLFGRLRRTVVRWPDDPDRPLEWATVADTLVARPQALCVVNLKRHARTLIERLKGAFSDGLFHLSTSMCPAHRTDALERVRHRLRADRRCVLVSTQCIEAGVDIDFPVVWRAFGPLDAIAQAAGRCNREGTLAFGEVTIFLPRDGSENPYPSPAYRQAAELTLVLLRSRGAAAMDINDPDLFRDYFRQLYDVNRPEEAELGLQRAITSLDFAEVARRYRLIKDDAINVVVPYGEFLGDRGEDDQAREGLFGRSRGLSGYPPVHRGALPPEGDGSGMEFPRASVGHRPPLRFGLVCLPRGHPLRPSAWPSASGFGRHTDRLRWTDGGSAHRHTPLP